MVDLNTRQPTGQSYAFKRIAVSECHRPYFGYCFGNIDFFKHAATSERQSAYFVYTVGQHHPFKINTA